MEEKILSILKEFKIEIANNLTLASVNEIRVKYLGKAGLLTSILRGMKEVSKEDRPKIGNLVNETREKMENLLKTTQDVLEEEKLNKDLENEKIDITEPSKGYAKGALHPLSRIFDKLIDTCVSMGFSVVTGPEVETDYYNFEALNVPKDHPARDMQDSFFVTNDIVLRSQTSSVQVHSMESLKPPFKIISPGRTYRSDSDATHTPVFHQTEGLVIDENVSMVDLKAMLEKLLRMLFGTETQIRFRPSYFPFTEPSVEVDATCQKCKGAGCKLCKGTGYMEMLGAGMVNPKVLENAGIDSKKYRGFAFGVGCDRLAMIVNNIPDLRMCFENDQRFLDQLK